MSDPVDTDALRKTARKAGAAIAAAALNGGRIQMRVPADPESDTDLLVTALECDALAAADEVDRLRTELAEGLAITKQHAKDSARERRLLERDVHRLRLAWEEAESARSAAAAYGERLRAVIENAPHEEDGADGCMATVGGKCDCWKAGAL